MISLLANLLTIFSFLLFNPNSLSLALTSDGISLLSLKYSILLDPLSTLNSWSYLDSNPCSWKGITCSPDHNVIKISLPHTQLSGSIPPELGLINTLQHLDLAGNLFNDTIPNTLFNASNLQVLNLSHNSFTGQLPSKFNSLFFNLSVVKLDGNQLTGNIPSELGSVQSLDLSSNLFNGSLPLDFGRSGLKYLNLSNNKISGVIPPEFVANVPENSTVDLSFNSLSGQIPDSKALLNQDPGMYSGNKELCGKPLETMCIVPSTLSNPPNSTGSISPAIAVKPKPMDSTPDGAHNDHNNGLSPATIVGITLADLAGVGVLGAVFFYFYQRRSKNQKIPDEKIKNPDVKTREIANKDNLVVQIDSTTKEQVVVNNMYTRCLSYCLRGDETEDGASFDTRTTSEGDEEDGGGSEGGSLVMVDGETELEVDVLLKASAFVLGGSGSSIVYKAVLQDGRIFAVRRLGEVGVDKFKDFESQVKAISKVKHPNLVGVRGLYWGSDEKLVIFDYVSNGSLATSALKKNGSTPNHLPLLVRLKIARGVAKGLAYIHDKKHVHGNIKPTNILLTPDMEPIISDLGLNLLVYGPNADKGNGQFGSKRQMGSCDGPQELLAGGSPHINQIGGSTNGGGSPYQAPESVKNLKPNPKWDVYSFGVVLLELLTGKVYMDGIGANAIKFRA